jgi:hypothetical protein
MSDRPERTQTPKKKKGLLIAAVKAIGTAAGLVASALGVHDEATPPASAAPARKGKLAPKHKSRLPRRVKKALRTQHHPDIAST